MSVKCLRRRSGEYITAKVCRLSSPTWPRTDWRNIRFKYVRTIVKNFTMIKCSLQISEIFRKEQKINEIKFCLKYIIFRWIWSVSFLWTKNGNLSKLLSWIFNKEFKTCKIWYSLEVLLLLYNWWWYILHIGSSDVQLLFQNFTVY